jgi:hypothetical protein
MVVRVPGAGPREVRVIYVTDSPAWKPSYRVTFDDATDRAELEAWAVVDNVSGEDWNRVTVGVGSTSALSFRYDLHSVRVVERETLMDEAATVAAPPTGGSPYAVASAEVPLVAALDEASMERLLAADTAPPANEMASGARDTRVRSKARRKHQTYSAAPMSAGMGVGAASVAGAPRPATRRPPANPLDALVQQIEAQPGRVRIEGFARADDDDKRQAGMARAESLRDRLVARGVAAEKIEAASFGRVHPTQAVRLVAASVERTAAEQPKSDAGAEAEPSGSAYFVAPGPMSIERDHSAMVSLLRERVRAERVYYYDPVSERGSKDLAFRAVRIENPTEYTLDRGPFTVYAKGQFLGEGLSEPVPPKSTAFVPYALDRQVVVEPEISGREEIHRLLTVERGIVTAEMKSIRTTKLTLANRSEKDAVVFVRHAVPKGWKLAPTELPLERFGSSHLVRVEVPAKHSATVSLEETQPLVRTIDMHAADGAGSVALFVENQKGLPPALAERIQEVLALHRDVANVEQRLEMLEGQMREYRDRVDELNVQLVTLRRVRTATELSRHLAKKMEEISQRLQKATIEAADLREGLMTRRIRIQDAIAELTLDEEPTRTATEGRTSPPPS